MANCTGFQMAFLSGEDACGSAEIRINTETMVVCIPEINSHQNFAEGLVEKSDSFVYVGLGGVEHGSEAEDVAHEAAFADEEAVVAGAFHHLRGLRGRRLFGFAVF